MPLRRSAFTLVELLIVIALVAVLLSILLPALGAARRSAQDVQCLANLRQIATASLTYAQDEQGYSPALGVPWTTPPFWALEVQRQSGVAGTSAAQLYHERSLLVCVAANRTYAGHMTRTYAVNVTGHAGAVGDPDHYDTGRAHIKLWALKRPADSAWYFDSAVAPVIGDGPPPTRTISTLDFRAATHVANRLGYYHQPRRDHFQVARCDGSAAPYATPPTIWQQPLP